MPKTAVGLFENTGLADTVVDEIASLGLPRNEIRELGEPLDFATTGVTSIPRIDFEVQLTRELMRIGATKEHAEAFVDGVRRRGVLVFATGADDKVDAAAQIMNRHSALASEEIDGPEPEVPGMVRDEPVYRDTQVQAGRKLGPSSGASLFIW